MPKDSRLPRILHALMHLDEIGDPVTSEAIGEMLGANPSLIRRTMAGLKKAGMVTSTKGHHGGWILAKPLDAITMYEVYEALGSPNLFSLGKAEDKPDCLLEQAANRATNDALAKAEATFIAELQTTTVADLVEGARDKIEAYRAAHREKAPAKS